MKLDSPLTFNKYIQPICLPSKMWLKPGDNTTIAGWGSTNPTGRGFSTVLNQAVVPLIDTRVCNTPSFYGGSVLPGMLCAGYEQGNIDSCNGDSGGPMFALNPQDHSYYLFGVVSWGFGCARPSKPGVYADIVYFHNWIQQHIKDDTSCQKLEPLKNGNLSHCETTVGSVCEFSCGTGYTLTSGNKTRTCTVNGWTGKHPTCAEKRCSALDEQPDGAHLNCVHNKEAGSYVCFINCYPGYFFMSGSNNYVTCGRESMYGWSYGQRDPQARLPGCTSGYFVNIKLPVQLKYLVQNCNTDIETGLLSEKLENAVNRHRSCRHTCQISKINVTCMDSGSSLSEILVDFEVLLPNIDQNIIPEHCTEGCKQLNMFALLQRTALLDQYLKSTISANPIEFETEHLLLDDSYNKKQRPYLWCDAGKVLTRSRICGRT